MPVKDSQRPRIRPPTLNITQAIERRPSIQVEEQTPVSGVDTVDDNDDDDEMLQLSSPESGAPSPLIPVIKGEGDEILRDLAELNELRKNLKQNLKVRPIRSRPNLKDGATPFQTSTSSVWKDRDGTLDSATSTSSLYFTPVTEAPATSASESFPILDYITPRPPTAVSPKALHDRLRAPKRPLLIDTRPLAAHEAFHIKYSVNIAIPSIILRRSKKTTGGGPFQTLDALRQYVTTERGKRIWDELMGGAWDGDVVIYDDVMDVKDKGNIGVTAWAIMPVITPLLSYGTVDYLEGGLSSAGHDPDLETLIVTGDEAAHATPLKGLFQLDTNSTTLRSSKPLPELEPGSSTLLLPPEPLPSARSPLPVMPSISATIDSDSPSPPPSSIMGFRRPPPPMRRPTAPPLTRIASKSMERLTLNTTNLPKPTPRNKPMRSATLAAPPTLRLQVPPSPGHLKLVHSNHSPVTPTDGNNPLSPGDNEPRNFMTPYFTPPHTPKASFGSFVTSEPSTARPEDEAPTTEEDAYPAFTVSTILPNFLYLGPELTTQEHVDELQELGVKRILNIAVECDDDHGLGLKQVFEKYLKIPMRDTVEEDNITKGVREVCDFLDDARLHSAPTYVHCKAGKSRSVTAVMAYLIHANRWTLSRAYSFVLERRKGISPNIGFVSELMNFEEQELGNKSNGVQPSAPVGSADVNMEAGFGAAVASGSLHGRSRAHVRESLPPALGLEGFRSASLGSSGLTSAGEPGVPGSIASAGVLNEMDRVMGDSGQEVEVKDASGRYRHMRRPPVNENTLQPMRRVSKAGLESSAYS